MNIERLHASSSFFVLIQMSLIGIFDGLKKEKGMSYSKAGRYLRSRVTIPGQLLCSSTMLEPNLQLQHPFYLFCGYMRRRG